MLFQEIGYALRVGGPRLRNFILLQKLPVLSYKLTFFANVQKWAIHPRIVLLIIFPISLTPLIM